jgi:serine-type D-Ala-D-Ala carboxypeptidase (penicillin-binding protein 5/6)
VHRRVAATVLAVAATILACATATLAGPPPETDAGAVLVGNGATGRILHGERQAEERAIASITKIMTALVVLDRADPDEIVTVPPVATTIGESSLGLRAGETLTVRELLTALLVYSANDAAYALAAHVGKGDVSRFVTLMNRKATELELRDTHFARPDGLDAPEHYSSARDVFKLARIAMRKPLFAQLVTIPQTTVAGRAITNRNDLLFSYPGIVGVKTGHTSDAGWSEVAAARRDGVTIYAVVLGGPSRGARNADLAELLDWGFDRYRRVPLVRTGHEYAEALVPYSDETLSLVADDQVVAVAEVGRPLVERVVAPAMVTLPVEKGQKLGEVTISDGDKVLVTRPLVAAE